MSTIDLLGKLAIQSTSSMLQEHVGRTPLLELRNLTDSQAPGVRVLAKAEWFNPSGSIKDRAALNIIQTGLRTGSLRDGRRLLDSTSGNMGIAYATFGAAMRIPITLCVPQSASPERIKILDALGAEVILTDASEGSDGAMRMARSIVDRNPTRYWYANQYDNPANWQAHFLGTGPEIAEQTSGQLTHFVAGVGTSGTLMGVGRYLRQKLPGVRVVSVEPQSALHGLEGLKHMPTAERPGIFDPRLADAIETVETEAAYEMVRELARNEGLFVGISSGAAAIAAIRIAQSIKEGTVVTVFPDAGFKYLSDESIWSRHATQAFV